MKRLVTIALAVAALCVGQAVGVDAQAKGKAMNATGTVKLNASPGRSGGGGSHGCALWMVSMAARSSNSWPDAWAMRLETR